MSRRVLAALLLGAALLLAACGQDDPQASLEAAVQQLQDNLEARDTRAVMAQLDPKFRAQDSLDQAWARQTMTLVFLRHAQVKVIAVARSSRIDPVAPDLGSTQAQVLLTGAQDLWPERMAPYAVELSWRRHGPDWKLFDLTWQ